MACLFKNTQYFWWKTFSNVERFWCIQYSAIAADLLARAALSYFASLTVKTLRRTGRHRLGSCCIVVLSLLKRRWEREVWTLWSFGRALCYEKSFISFLLCLTRLQWSIKRGKTHITSHFLFTTDLKISQNKYSDELTFRQNSNFWH